jgi:nitric oxide reductase NorD protein
MNQSAATLSNRSLQSPLGNEEIERQLDVCLEVEFTFLHVEDLAQTLAGMPREEQEFILQWTRRVASTNIQLAFEFASRAEDALALMDRELISSWCLHAMDHYDTVGLHQAMSVIRDMQGFMELGHLRAYAALFEEASAVLQPFVQGLSGRRLKLVLDEQAWTDGEIIYLPGIMARLEDEQRNFQLYKATATHLWALTRFGSLNVDPLQAFAAYPDKQHAQSWFHTLERIRLDARIAREFPGLFRQMLALRGELEESDWPGELDQVICELGAGDATVDDSLMWLSRLYARDPPPVACYQGQLNLDAAWQARDQRLLRDKARLRETLRIIAEEIAEGKEDRQPPASFDLLEQEGDEEGSDLPQLDLLYLDQLMPVPEHVRDLLTSIQLDLLQVPEDYLVPAGPGEYDASLLQDETQDPDDVWAGTYHEEGAFLYDEWDFGRHHYRKNWCVLREVDMQLDESDFYACTVRKYKGHIKSLHRTFEVLRGEDKLLRRQMDGEDVDLDAFVESWADVHSGLEMTDRLFTRMHKDERNIAVIFMVDMSGSTKGWINDAEREALVLLVEALEILGDRYAIYGFSGWSRKRCDAFHIKTFEDVMDDRVKAAIGGIAPKDYTRMGAPIRHFSRMLQQVEARTKLLITISDGKPDDYDHYYRGEYGIEDTRQALFEARVSGIHPFCITIDKEGAGYLPHMYGPANYIVLDDVAKLPLKVSDIYRKITS